MKAGRARTRLAGSALAFLAFGCARADPDARVHTEARAVEAQEKDPGAPSLALTDLRCEHELEPLAVETSAPRFSWKLAASDATRRGLAQSAYRVLVATSEAELAQEHGDLWDSGEVKSNETVDVAYAGRTLRSFERGFYKVRVWDQDDAPSSWSATAQFGMGALAPSDWHAQWIGCDTPSSAERPEPDLKGAEWIEGPGGEHELWLRRRFELANLDDLRAGLVLAAADEYELYLNGKPVLKNAHAPGTGRTTEIAKVAKLLVAGTNVLAARVRSTGATPAALCLKLVLRPGPAQQEIVSDASWRATTSASAGSDWQNAGFDDSTWSTSALLSAADEDALGPIAPPSTYLPPPRHLRTEFHAPSAPVRATLLASALGVYALELDGAPVSADWFAPGWSDYTKRSPYRAYDVTALVHEGDNALGVVLGDGWYAGYLGRRGQRNSYGSAPRFLAQLVLEYADGTRELVTSDARWRATTSGPTREADLYMGEHHDARAELAGWSTPGFDARAWSPVDVAPAVSAPLVAHSGPAIGVIAELTPVAITPRPGGRYLFDLGQNIAGVARLALEAPAGTTIVLRFGEALEPDGSLWRKNLGWARASDQYVCKGGGVERWQPRFTYHGFRYVEVAGLPSPPTPETITGLALSSATTLAGDFTCSDPMVNKLVENARWTLRANSMDIPTDCPQRGERLGWTGDAQLFAPSALWLADLQTLYDKWTIDLADAQRADGRFPAIAPAWENVPDGGPAWADAGVLVPAQLFRFYGDLRLVERQYESMQRFLAAYERESGAECKPPEKLEAYGDWHCIGTDTPKGLLYLAYFTRCARQLGTLAHALGRESDSRHDFDLCSSIFDSFGQLFVDAEGHVQSETQTAYALALQELLVPPDLRTRAGAHLLAELERHGGKLTTGFVGTPELLPALSASGRSAVAYRLLRSHEFPSWGSMIDHGATSLWERWDAWTPEHGFANDGSVSLSHTPLGSVVAWLFDTAAGLHPNEAGFRRISFAPVPGGGLTFVDASYDSVRGRIALRWEITGDELHLDVRVPPNVTATLLIPTRAPASATEGAQPLERALGVRVGRTTPEGLLVELTPGSYSFTCREPVLAR